jgi:hypothetical protein
MPLEHGLAAEYSLIVEEDFEHGRDAAQPERELLAVRQACRRDGDPEPPVLRVEL